MRFKWYSLIRFWRNRIKKDRVENVKYNLNVYFQYLYLQFSDICFMEPILSGSGQKDLDPKHWKMVVWHCSFHPRCNNYSALLTGSRSLRKLLLLLLLRPLSRLVVALVLMLLLLVMVLVLMLLLLVMVLLFLLFL